MTIPIHTADLDKLAEIVRQDTGNNIQKKNYSMLESRIKTRIFQLKLASMEQYWEYFQANDKVERQHLTGLMTTHYTFFFREYTHFELLEAWLAKELFRLEARFKQTQQPVKIWSAAASKGQEIYSLAIFFEHNLFKKYGIKYEVIGTDIDQDSIEFARNGVYPLKEVNSIPKIYLDGYWRLGSGPIADFAAISKEIKSKVKFETLNILEADTWQNKDKFDVIFCRNIFIYFSDENVKKIAFSLKNKSYEKGLIVTGVSEPLRFDGWDMKTIGPSCYYNYTAPVNEEKVTTSVTTEHLVAADKSVPLIEIIPQIKYKVLCVDDSKTMQNIMKKIFKEDQNCELVECANHGGFAREMLDQKKYDLITLDINMPEVDGVMFLEKFYKKDIDPPVIMVSSVNRQDQDLATKAMSLGAFDYVEKPTMNNLDASKEELLMKVRTALKSKAPGAHNVTINKNDNFDEQVSKNIIIPHIEQCLRVIVSDVNNYDKLDSILKSQTTEHDSPANMFILQNATNMQDLQVKLSAITEKNVIIANNTDIKINSNLVYLCNNSEQLFLFLKNNLRFLSIQFINFDLDILNLVQARLTPQILIDESLADEINAGKYGSVKFSDIVPATSFSSLAIEFFASLRGG